MNLWERQPGESARAFAAFQVYRDLGPGRSLDEVARRLHRGPGEGQKRARTGRISDWSSQWRWVERARAWDDELDRVACAEQARAVKEMNRRHAEEAVQYQAKALARLGKMMPEELSAADALKYFVEAVKIERLARGEPETVTEQRQKGQQGNDRDVARIVLADPKAAELACQLFERIAAAQPSTNGAPHAE